MNDKTVLLICDVWDTHWCADLRRRTESLAGRINDFTKIVRQLGGRVLHCPSETVDSYYGDWAQRKAMGSYPKARATVSQEMQQVSLPLDTTHTMGCPDLPPCRWHTEFTKQHDGIEILPEDLVSDNGQEVYNFIVHEGIECVLMAGAALNMCVLGRPFGIQSLVGLGVPVRVVSDLVEVFYNPIEPPYITIEQAKWLALGYIEAKWCPVTTCYKEAMGIPKETSMRIHSNVPGPLLARLRRQHHLDFFVETGSAYGDTAELAAIMFDRVWSCDIDPVLVKWSAVRLTDYTNVTLGREYSPDFLRRIKPELTQPTLYWLDAHWCGGSIKPDKECPLLEEIEAIGSFRGPFDGHSVLLIDDINLIESPPPPPHDPAQWPTMEQLRVALNAWGEPYKFEWYQGPASQIRSHVLVVMPEDQQ